jgi:hypothetical protein
VQRPRLGRRVERAISIPEQTPSDRHTLRANGLRAAQRDRQLEHRRPRLEERVAGDRDRGGAARRPGLSARQRGHQPVGHALARPQPAQLRRAQLQQPVSERILTAGQTRVESEAVDPQPQAHRQSDGQPGD